MYVIDASGNALIDTAIQDEVEKATRDRTLSPRAAAILNPSSISLKHLTRDAEAGFATRVSTMIRDVALRLGLITKAQRANDGLAGMHNDANSMLSKIMSRAISRGLAGFPGVIPIITFSGWNHFRVAIPADGAVIRYLARAIKGSGLSFLEVSISSGQLGDSGTTIDGHGVAVRPDSMMYIVVKQNSPNIRNNGSLMLRGLEIAKLSEGICQITKTLSRRCYTVDGRWGEYPKFPIFNFLHKMGRPGVLRRHINHNLASVAGAEVRGCIHGNNQDLFGDKSVYAAMDAFAKSPFSTVSNRNGEVQYEWKDPRRS